MNGVALTETADESALLGDFLQSLGQVGEVWTVLRLERPAHEQDVLNLPRSLKNEQKYNR